MIAYDRVKYHGGEKEQRRTLKTSSALSFDVGKVAQSTRKNAVRCDEP